MPGEGGLVAKERDLRLQGEANSTSTLTFDFQLSELGENKSLLFELCSWQCFAMAAVADY